ncbi:MAG: hypothetical protein J2P47_14340, partial [Acetobacteraceae bacterium]|nr:hypothetical protein [Acetobacteraceae bacterium]
SGGAALAAFAAAAAGGVAAGAVAKGLSAASENAEHAVRQQAAKRGMLVLSVHLRDPDRSAIARRAMQEAGASRVDRVRRVRA